MAILRQAGSIVIAGTPEELFNVVSDVTRMGDWSPVCTACWWDEGDAPGVGARFTGRNEVAERTWETKSEVVVADPGREFAWVVAEPPTRARWGYTFEAVDGGTKVTETWELPPEGVAFFEQHFGEDADAEIGAAQYGRRARHRRHAGRDQGERRVGLVTRGGSPRLRVWPAAEPPGLMAARRWRAATPRGSAGAGCLVRGAGRPGGRCARAHRDPSRPRRDT